MPTMAAQPAAVADYIALCAEDGFGTSPSGREYALLSRPKDSFRLRAIAVGDVDALTANIVQRYRDGILLDDDRQVSLICNWAHANDVDAVTLLRAVSSKVAQLGDAASGFQRRTKINVDAALARLGQS